MSEILRSFDVEVEFVVNIDANDRDSAIDLAIEAIRDGADHKAVEVYEVYEYED